MNIKSPIANSSKSVDENNIKKNVNTNIIIKRELNSILSKGVDLKKEIIETLTQFVRWRV